MKPISRIVVGLCALAMTGAYFFPIWMIMLDAPQYPEGLSMFIWINDVKGDVNTINGLNHYIGMKHISTDMFPEFSYMKYILGGVIGFGLLAAISNSKKVTLAWMILLFIVGVAGVYDFYQWEYDYGHNLSDTAAIKVPGMSYQPPLLGYKDLLNFTAGSFPDIGGYCVIVPGILLVCVTAYEWLFSRRKKAAGAAYEYPAKLHLKPESHIKSHS